MCDEDWDDCAPVVVPTYAAPVFQNNRGAGGGNDDAWSTNSSGNNSNSRNDFNRFPSREFTRGGGGRGAFRQDRGNSRGRGGDGSRSERFGGGGGNRWNNQDSSERSDRFGGGGGRWNNHDTAERSDGSNRWNNQEFSERSDRFGGGGGNRRNNQDASEVIKVPSSYVGRIIGRGGSKINELQSESGARIQVTKDTEGDETVVKLFGDEQALQKAKELINNLTADRQTFTFVEAKDLPAEEPKEAAVIDWQKLFKESEKAAAAEFEKIPMKKQFYTVHPEVARMSDSEVERFRLENNNIVVDRTFKTENSRPIPKPCPKFEHAFHQYPEILEEIRKAGFENPSPIQAQGWPVLLSGEDLIGIAQTGTGKTLAFLLPAFIHIDGQPISREDRGGPAVLIMAPTRELALQIDKEIKKYQYRGITSVCVYGGGNRREQVKVVTEGVDIVIATPGRLNDLYDAGHLNVKSVTYVVLDEADRMLDMGFEPQIRKVMYAIRPTRQTVMTSATWPLGVRRLAQSYMDDPVQVYVGTLDLAATHTVTQVVLILPEGDEAKFEAFKDFVHNLTPEQKVIVFCGKKARADDLSTELIMAGVHCQTMHGDRDQSDREQALLDITNGTVQILIATDVASRGLDIDDITHVLNYDFPRNIEEYVHRVGRTGRAGKYGESISYFTRSDWAQAQELINILAEAEQFIPEELYGMAERYKAWLEKKEREGPRGRGGRGGGRRW